MSKREPVPSNVLMRCLRVKDLECREDVYCLDVPTTNAFAAGESGILIHNCMDCMRYLVMTHSSVARTDPSGDYDYYVERISANDDGFRRAINAIKNADDSNFGLAGTYH